MGDTIPAYGESSSDTPLNRENFQDFLETIETSTDNIIVRVVTDKTEDLLFPVNAFVLMNVVRVSCTLFEAVNRLDEVELFKDYYETEGVYFNL